MSKAKDIVSARLSGKKTS